MAARVAIVYGSKFGQTGKVATRIADELALRHIVVDLVRGNALPRGFRVDRYDGVVIGASMIISGYQAYIRTFVRTHGPVLNRMPSAFVAVSGSAGSHNASERDEAVRIARTFCAECGWRPTVIESVAGAIAFTKYNFLVRMAMKRIARLEGVSTDTSRDHEYTDWAQVERFAERFAALVAPAPASSLASASVPEPAAR
jgi:menaquinone-dependent protoporphyrinogen oxidase